MQLTGGCEAQETAKFIIMFDKFFDVLNVRSFTEGTRSRKPFLHPYRHGNDQRLDVSYNYVIKIIDFINVQWLKQEFLPYMDAWEASVDALEGFTDVEKKRMLLSQETLLGIRRTGI